MLEAETFLTDTFDPEDEDWGDDEDEVNKELGLSPEEFVLWLDKYTVAFFSSLSKLSNVEAQAEAVIQLNTDFSIFNEYFSECYKYKSEVHNPTVLYKIAYDAMKIMRQRAAAFNFPQSSSTLAQYMEEPQGLEEKEEVEARQAFEARRTYLAVYFHDMRNQLVLLKGFGEGYLRQSLKQPPKYDQEKVDYARLSFHDNLTTTLHFHNGFELDESKQLEQTDQEVPGENAWVLLSYINAHLEKLISAEARGLSKNKPHLKVFFERTVDNGVDLNASRVNFTIPLFLRTIINALQNTSRAYKLDSYAFNAFQDWDEKASQFPISIKVHVTKTAMHMVIDDFGPGFPPENLAKEVITSKFDGKKIDRYVPEKGKTKGHKDGTGYGLFGIYSSVNVGKKRESTLETGNHLDENGETKGARLEFTLPLLTQGEN